MGCKWSFATVAEKPGLLEGGGRSLVCPAQEPRPCLVPKPGHTVPSKTVPGLSTLGQGEVLGLPACCLATSVLCGSPCGQAGFTAPPSSSKPSS